MKLLHTADWHLCDVFHRLDRTPQLRAQVSRVAALCEEHAVDVLVIAGDVFSDHAAVTIEKMTAELEFLQATFAAFFAHGGTILAITGNHDRDSRIDIIRAGMSLADVRSGTALAPGRMYLANRPALVQLAGVQFALVPYPFHTRYALPHDDFKTAEEAHRAVTGRVAEWVRQLPQRADYRRDMPGVLVAHLHVMGAVAHSLYKVSAQDDVVFEEGFIPPQWAYVALGHIHKPQSLSNCDHIRYPGPLEKLSFDEVNDERGVVLLELNATGLVGTPQWLPLPATPMYDIVAQDIADIEARLEEFPLRETALTRIALHDTPGLGQPEQRRRLAKFFPMLLDVKWLRGPTVPGTATTLKPKADYRETVREHLKEKLKDDPDAAAILALAETFLSQEATR